MPNKTIKNIQEAAEKLYTLRQVIEIKELEFKGVVDGLKQERDALQQVLIKKMTDNDLISLKVKNGDSFFKAKSRGVEVTNEALAHSWAVKNGAVKIDKIIAKQILKELKDVPDGFKFIETEYIGVRKAKK